MLVYWHVDTLIRWYGYVCMLIGVCWFSHGRKTDKFTRFFLLNSKNGTNTGGSFHKSRRRGTRLFRDPSPFCAPFACVSYVALGHPVDMTVVTWTCVDVVMIVLMCWCKCCWCVDVLMCWWLYWWIALVCWWLCWCIDVLMIVLMCSIDDYVDCVDVLMWWCCGVDVWMCGCVDVLMTVLMIVLMYRCVDDCVDVFCWWLCWLCWYVNVMVLWCGCVDVWMCWWLCWWLCWYVLLMCWCVDVLMWVDVLMTVINITVLMCWCVDVLKCWCCWCAGVLLLMFGVLVYWCMVNIFMRLCWVLMWCCTCPGHSALWWTQHANTFRV
jgi:hypothetical protein